MIIFIQRFKFIIIKYFIKDYISGRIEYMKKRKKVLIIILVPLLTIAALGVGFFGTFYVNDSTKKEVYDDFDLVEFAPSLMSKSLDNAKDTAKMNLQISEKELNSVIFSVVEDKIPENIRQYTDGVYLTIDENGHYYFVVKANFYGFRTIAKLSCTLDYIKNQEDIGESYIEFKIQNYQLGRVQDLGGIIHFIMEKVQLKDLLQNILAGLGFNFVVDLDNDKITYKVKDAIADIKNNLISGESSSYEMFFYLFEEFIRQDIVKFNFYEDNKMNINILLDRLGDNSISGKALNLDIHNNVTERVETLMDNNAINDEQVTDMFQYFFHGYDHVDANVRSVVNDTDFSAISPTWDKTGYQGFSVLHTNTDLGQIIQDQVTGNPESFSKLTHGEVFAHLEENQLDSFLRDKDTLIGYNLLLTRNEEDGYVCNYLAISDIYTDVSTGYLRIYVGLSFNGYERNVVLTCEDTENTSPYEIKYVIRRIQVGDREIQSDLGEQLISYIGSAFGSLSDFQLEVDPLGDNIGYVTFNFEDSLDSTYKVYIDSNHKKLTVEETEMADGNGLLQLRAVDQ